MYKSFNAWSADGYRIKKGSKAHWIDGKPMFDDTQVYIPQRWGRLGRLGHADDRDYLGYGDYHWDPDLT